MLKQISNSLRILFFLSAYTVGNQLFNLFSNRLLLNHLSLETFGILNLFLFWSTVWSILAGLGINFSYNYFYTKNKVKSSSYILPNYLLVYIFSTFLLWVFGFIANGLVFSWHIFCISIFGFSLGILAFANTYFVVNKKQIVYSIYNLILSFVLFFLLYLGKSFYDDQKLLQFRVFSIVSVYSIFAIILIYFFKLKLSYVRITKVRVFVKIGIPFSSLLLLNFLLPNINKIFVQKFIGIDGVGVYSFCLSIPLMTIILNDCIANLLNPKILDAIKVQSYKRAKELVNYSFFIYFAIVLLTTLFLKPIILVLAGAKFLQYEQLCNYLLVCFVWSYFIKVEFFLRQSTGQVVPYLLLTIMSNLVIYLTYFSVVITKTLSNIAWAYLLSSIVCICSFFLYSYIKKNCIYASQIVFFLAILLSFFILLK